MEALTRYRIEARRNDSCLFSTEELNEIAVAVNDGPTSIHNGHSYRKAHCNNLNLCLSTQTSGPYQMPVIAPFTGTIPSRLMC